MANANAFVETKQQQNRLIDHLDRNCSYGTMHIFPDLNFTETDITQAASDLKNITVMEIWQRWPERRAENIDPQFIMHLLESCPNVKTLRFMVSRFDDINLPVIIDQYIPQDKNIAIELNCCSLKFSNADDDALQEFMQKLTSLYHLQELAIDLEFISLAQRRAENIEMPPLCRYNALHSLLLIASAQNNSQDISPKLSPRLYAELKGITELLIEIEEYNSAVQYENLVGLISNLPSLNRLGISSNALPHGDRADETLFKAITGTNIASLHLDIVFADASQMATLFALLPRMCTLQNITIERFGYFQDVDVDASVTAETASIIGEGLSQLKKISFVKLRTRSNESSSLLVKFPVILETVCKSKQLQHLEIIDSELGDMTWRLLSSRFESYPLQRLSLRSCYLRRKQLPLLESMLIQKELKEPDKSLQYLDARSIVIEEREKHYHNKLPPECIGFLDKVFTSNPALLAIDHCSPPNKYKDGCKKLDALSQKRIAHWQNWVLVCLLVKSHALEKEHKGPEHRGSIAPLLPAIFGFIGNLSDNASAFLQPPNCINLGYNNIGDQSRKQLVMTKFFPALVSDQIMRMANSTCTTLKPITSQSASAVSSAVTASASSVSSSAQVSQSLATATATGFWQSNNATTHHPTSAATSSRSSASSGVSGHSSSPVSSSILDL
ncbi:MAG: hypothetical protein M1561_04055 [Gammaproteobacteria bacterium]|nr:hypothetical protein [Gammaproteobacteria bacterium]